MINEGGPTLRILCTGRRSEPQLRVIAIVSPTTATTGGKNKGERPPPSFPPAYMQGQKGGGRQRVGKKTGKKEGKLGFFLGHRPKIRGRGQCIGLNL